MTELTERKLPIPLINLNEPNIMPLYVSEINYADHKDTIDKYVVNNSGNAVEDCITCPKGQGIDLNNGYVAIKITPPNMCELLTELNIDLVFKTFPSGISGAHSYYLACNIIGWNITHKIELLQILIKLYGNVFCNLNDYSFDKLLNYIFKYDNKYVWIIIPQFYLTTLYEYMYMFHRIFENSNDDRLIEPFVYFINRLVGDDKKYFEADTQPHYYPSYTNCIKTTLGRSNTKMLNMFLDKFHQVYLMTDSVIITALCEQSYTDIDIIMKYYLCHELKVEHKSPYDHHKWVEVLKGDNLVYFTNLICDDKIIFDIDSIHFICARSYSSNNLDLLYILLIFYPLIADDYSGLIGDRFYRCAKPIHELKKQNDELRDEFEAEFKTEIKESKLKIESECCIMM